MLSPYEANKLKTQVHVVKIKFVKENTAVVCSLKQINNKIIIMI